MLQAIFQRITYNAAKLTPMSQNAGVTVMIKGKRQKEDSNGHVSLENVTLNLNIGLKELGDLYRAHVTLTGDVPECAYKNTEG